MVRELLIYGLVPAVVLLVWAYQWLADRFRGRVRRWRRNDIRADQLLWWVQDHFRGSAVRSVETRPLPAVGTSGSTPTAGLQPNSDRNNTRWTEQWAAKKRAKRIARNRTGGNTPASTVTRSETRSSTTTEPRTSVRSGSAVPRSCGPHPAAGVLGRSPVAGPKQPVDAAIPPTGVDRHPTPRSGEIHEGHEGAVVREATAPARSAA